MHHIHVGCSPSIICLFLFFVLIVVVVVVALLATLCTLVQFLVYTYFLLHVYEGISSDQVNNTQRLKLKSQNIVVLRISCD